MWPRVFLFYDRHSFVSLIPKLDRIAISTIVYWFLFCINHRAKYFDQWLVIFRPVLHATVDQRNSHAMQYLQRNLPSRSD